VDDSEIALRFLQTRLEPWGLQIDRASGSDRALQLLAERSYDFVFLDMELGEGSDLDGLTLCQHIKRHHGSGEGAALVTSVIMVSAHHSELDRVRGTLAGCDAFLGKPLQEAELRRLLLRQGLEPPPDPQQEDDGGDDGP
jgi:CheY-like chemotaxis protein